MLIDGRSIYTPAVLGRLLGRPGRDAGGRRPHRDHPRPRRHPVGGQRRQRRDQHPHQERRATPRGRWSAVGGGTEERALASFRQGGKIGEGTAYRAYGKYSYRDSLAFANGGSARDPLRRGQAGFRARPRRRAASGALTLQGDAYHGLAGQTVVARADTDLDGANLLGRWTQHLRGELGRATSRSITTTPTARSRDWFEEHRHTLDIDYQHRQPIGARQELVWGAGYRVTHDQVGNSPGVAFLPDRGPRTCSAPSRRTRSRCDSHLRLTVGTKVEHNAWTGFEVQPSVRLAWVPDERRTLWAAISRAVRTPTRSTRTRLLRRRGAPLPHRLARLQGRVCARLRARLPPAAADRVADRPRDLLQRLRRPAQRRGGSRPAAV